MPLLQAELGDGRTNHALLVAAQAVPLDQRIEGRHAQRKHHACSELVGLLLSNLLLPATSAASSQVRWQTVVNIESTVSTRTCSAGGEGVNMHMFQVPRLHTYMLTRTKVWP